MRDQVAIAGIGCTPYSKDSGVSTLTLASRAIMAALDDAGLDPDAVDGVATFRVGDSVLPAVLTQTLGVRDLRWYLDQFGGGSVSHSIVGQAALAIVVAMWGLHCRYAPYALRAQNSMESWLCACACAQTRATPGHSCTPTTPA